MQTIETPPPSFAKPVLVVEDDTDIRETLQQALELEGYSVLTALNGKDALDVLQQGDTPGLILLDLMMPVMNGWQFLEAKRSNENISGIPVVVITAAGDKAQAVSADAVIRKPIDLDALMDTVKRFYE